MKAFGIVILAVLAILVFNFIGGAAQVAQKEFSPQAMLTKYEWFKDASATIQEKENSIASYKTNIARFNEDYAGTSRKDWAREDKQEYNQLNVELQGMIQSYNIVVSEYNAASNKFNWEAFDATEGDTLARTFKKL